YGTVRRISDHEVSKAVAIYVSGGRDAPAEVIIVSHSGDCGISWWGCGLRSKACQRKSKREEYYCGPADKKIDDFHSYYPRLCERTFSVAISLRDCLFELDQRIHGMGSFFLPGGFVTWTLHLRPSGLR